MHGVSNGVPMIFAGTEADKGEVAARPSGRALPSNLRTSNPTEGAIRDAVDEVFSDDTVKSRTMELKRVNEELKAIEAIEA